MRVIGYIRVSTDEQERSGLGLEAQEAKVRAYCDLYGHELIALEVDAASGKNLRREGLDHALAKLRTKGAEGLVIAKLDRLTRSVRDMGELLERYFSGLASLLVVAEQIDTSTASGRMVLNLLTTVAQWERETIGERTKDALRAKRARGGKTGGDVPYGFTLEDGQLVEQDTEQKAIRLILDLRAEGYSFQRIAGQLNADGITTKRGCQWTPTQARRLTLRAA